MGEIVVGVDGSPASRAALRESVFEARCRGCDVLALHVVPIPIVTSYDYRAVDFEGLTEAGARLVEAELVALTDEFGGELPVRVTTRVALGHCAINLLEAAEEAELVVVGSRGHGGFRGLLTGSVTTYLAHHLPHRLLIVPDPAKLSDSAGEEVESTGESSQVG